MINLAIVLNEELVKRGLQENDNVISDLNAILSTISGLEFQEIVQNYKVQLMN